MQAVFCRLASAARQLIDQYEMHQTTKFIDVGESDLGITLENWLE
ncbi:MAG TPA: hypothetical protein ACFE0H_08980 [Elainellaceae cyanobacterium]|jgi:hypothetical protein